jgi:sodium/hydrogen antiporter
MIALVVIAAILVLYGAVSRPLDARGVTPALVLMLAGLLVGPSELGWFNVSLEAATAEHVAELALALLLFGDAARIDLRSLRAHLAWPGRLLLIGLPLTMIAGTLAGLLIFPGLAFASVALLAIMLASTDAALGQRVVTDETVPARVRQALNVESGLNDGLAVPFFLVFVDISLAQLHGKPVTAVIERAAAQIGWGLVAGVGAAVAGALVVRFADSRGWIESPWRQIMTLATAILAYAGAQALGGSGFIAAFAAGLLFGALVGAGGTSFTRFTEDAGDLLAWVTWIGFGALALGHSLGAVTWQVALYAVLSLTVVRMVPVALAMLGSGARGPTIAFVGWFGPRGLASIVFVLIALDDHVPDGQMLFTTVTCVVALSVVAHGLSSAPLVGRYSRWFATHVAAHSGAEEATPVKVPRARRQREAVATPVAASAAGRPAPPADGEG